MPCPRTLLSLKINSLMLIATKVEQLNQCSGYQAPNQLALTLESNERNCKHWLADISHELRMPLAILKDDQLFDSLLKNNKLIG